MDVSRNLLNTEALFMIEMLSEKFHLQFVEVYNFMNLPSAGGRRSYGVSVVSDMSVAYVISEDFEYIFNLKVTMFPFFSSKNKHKENRVNMLDYLPSLLSGIEKASGGFDVKNDSDPNEKYSQKHLDISVKHNTGIYSPLVNGNVLNESNYSKKKILVAKKLNTIIVPVMENVLEVVKNVQEVVLRRAGLQW